MTFPDPEDMYSFDVFDTVITRTVARPIDVFHLMQKTIQREFPALPSAVVTVFPAIRVRSESEARRVCGREDVRLDEIYAHITDKFPALASHRAELMELEMATERQVLVPIRATLAMIERIHAVGRNVMFVSDMYLPVDFIREILERCGAFRPGDELYVSGDLGLTKVTGNLYRHIITLKGCQPQQIVHYGDNIRSDQKIPSLLGIRGGQHLLGVVYPNHRENMMQSLGTSPGVTSALAGIARAVRLGRNHESTHRQTVWDTASDVIGPLYYHYVWWILRTAKRQNIDSLYFMARDGHILYKIATEIEQRHHYGINLRYLYVSRESLLIPAFAVMPERDYVWLINYLKAFNISTVCRTLNLDMERIGPHLERYCLYQAMWDSQFTHEDYLNLHAFLKDEQVGEILAEANRERYENTLGYLQQEGMTNTGRFALVDIGWHGNSQQAISSILEAAKLRPKAGVSGFYFGFGRKMQVYPGDSVFSFNAHHDIRKVMLHGSIYEVFAATDHAKTVGYAKSREGYAPVFNTDGNHAGRTWGVDIQHEAILEFCRHFADRVGPDEYDMNMVKSLVRTIAFRFFESPTPEEAEVYGSYSFSCYLAETDLADIAPKMSRREFWRRVLRKESVISLWFPGTFVRSGMLLEKWLWKISAVKRNVKSYIRVRFGRQNQYYFNADL